jgi:hypothetical protein
VRASAWLGSSVGAFLEAHFAAHPWLLCGGRSGNCNQAERRRGAAWQPRKLVEWWNRRDTLVSPSPIAAEDIMTTDRAFQLSLTGHRVPVDYYRPPSYSGMIAEKDVLVPMRDGVKIAADVYRPDTEEKLPAPLAFSIDNKNSATNVEYIPYHICSSKTVLHEICHDPAHPSHLLLPMIPNA